jgi:glyoxylase-like metal-dependent hydrolase (beta-lactamase superfamily II)
MTRTTALRERIGSFEITALFDGVIASPFDILTGIEPSDARSIVGSPTDRISMPAYAFLLTFGDKRALIDTGASNTMGPRLGQVVDSLRAHGVNPAEVDYIFLTHLHPDHSNGLVDADGDPLYPNADVFLHKDEAEFWLDREITRDTPQRLHKNIRATERATAPYRTRMHLVTDEEVLPGIAPLLCAGHTPGHCAWLLRSEESTLISWGDLVHAAALQLPRPDVGVIYDVDPTAAARTRAVMFQRIAQQRMMIAGAHLDTPFAYLRAEDGDYRLYSRPSVDSVNH